MGPSPHPPSNQPLEVTIATYYSLFQQYLDKLQADGQIVATTPASGQAVDCLAAETANGGRAAEGDGGFSATITAYATGTSDIDYLAETGSAVFIPVGLRYELMHDNLYWSMAGLSFDVAVTPNQPLVFSMWMMCHVTSRVWPDGPFDPVTFQPLPSSSASPTPTSTSTESPR